MLDADLDRLLILAPCDPAAAARLADLVAEAIRRPGGRAAFKVVQAGLHADRDQALAELGALVGADLSLSRRAEIVIGKIDRYRPLPVDAMGSAERRVLNRIAATGLPIPGKRQLRKILGPRNRPKGQRAGSPLP
jgi:hypothetical protein